jgi:hypothetical protein
MFKTAEMGLWECLDEVLFLQGFPVRLVLN